MGLKYDLYLWKDKFCWAVKRTGPIVDLFSFFPPLLFLESGFDCFAWPYEPIHQKVHQIVLLKIIQTPPFEIA